MFAAMKAGTIMRRPRLTLEAEDTIQAAAAKLYHVQQDAVPVLDADGCVLGTVTTDSLMTAMMKGLAPDTAVRDMMERTPVLAESEAPHGWRWDPPCLPVTAGDGSLSGMLYAEDWLQAVERAFQQQEELLLESLRSESDHVWLLDAKGEVRKETGVFAGRWQRSSDMPAIEALTTGTGTEETVVFDETTYHVSCSSMRTAAGTFTLVRLRTAGGEESGEWKEKAEQMEMVLELSHDGIIMVDREGIITMVNQEYADFIGQPQDALVGRHVTDVIENTRMHLVAESGRPEIADIQRIKGDYMVANRLPLYKDGHLVGAVGKVMFKNLGGFKALKRRIEKLEKELDTYRGEWQESNRAKYQFHQLIGESPAWQQTKRLAQQASETDSSVLLLGESGTGKELFAHAIHHASSRAPGPFVKVNCAAIPGDLIESELFGYVEGSFTGAKRGGKKGRFEAAEGGTIFLDEIGELPIHMQVKLLRVLQEREVEPIGSNASKQVDIRVIAATNRDLDAMIEDGHFRLDLFYRLNVFTLEIPPLRDRPDDLHVLVPHFLEKISTRLGSRTPELEDSAWQQLRRYHWPGNTRELENVIERMVNVVPDGRVLTAAHLPAALSGGRLDPPRPLADVLAEAEQQAIEQALAYTEGNKAQAARLLGISRTSFYEKQARLP
ncbi:sigma-54-dependent Fis family transcriptional regulator [Alkalicoccus chagannorensis]|uniref:sigma-54-dependent Fis family transcriptional regulator n=1 Tax=Alkalicoccus chagannorensis TaxID=427072 RepID=UPI000429FB15|nr:sigma-54-dependent Fis family transcriptional regulator [Alkalicoccus chagannorensis]